MEDVKFSAALVKMVIMIMRIIVCRWDPTVTTEISRRTGATNTMGTRAQ